MVTTLLLIDRITLPSVDLTDSSNGPFEARLYNFSGANVISALTNVYSVAIDNDLPVFAEPDYIMSPRPHGSFGSPSGGPPAPEAQGFFDQWAFSSIGGISELGGGRPGSPVAVFDTSPFATAGEWTISRPGHEFQLCALDVPTAFMARWQSGRHTSGGLIDTQVEATIEHGLFVSGLANAVSPNSPVTLVRVLDDIAYGDMQSLLVGLELYRRSANPGQVINLSLGVHTDDPPLHTLFFELKDNETRWHELYETIWDFVQAKHMELLGFAIDSPPYEGGPVIALRSLIRSIAAKNIVVAAAGNDAGGSASRPPSHFPAFWDEVISVGATNKVNGWPCYSNLGEVLAPGGDGGQAAAGQPACPPRQDICLDSECEFGLVGPVTTWRSTTGYAYWSGTSFATPLVSGLAALLLGECPGLTPSQVAQAILQGAQGDVINIPNTNPGLGTISGIGGCP
jgi:subtilisin family serine protease